MDATIIAAVAALLGSAIGGLTTFATTYVTQRHQIRRERVMREIEQRETLYGQFMEHAAELFIDSLDKSLEQPARLIGAAATLARIRLISDGKVGIAAERVLNAIIESYKRPPIAANAFLNETSTSFREPLEQFSLACRSERQSLLRQL